MKKIAIITAFISSLLLVATSSNATIRRVGFTASTSPVNGLDYATFQLAHDAANTGDTLQLYPSTASTSYSAILNKKLVILGAGYFYNSYTSPTPTTDLLNTGLQNLAGGVGGVSITIGVGSSGTYIAGFNGLSVTTSNIPDSLNNITITRSRNVDVNWDNSGVCNNWIISQCFGLTANQTAYGASFTGNRTITNFRIENCIADYNYSGFNLTLNTSPVGISSGQILNCTLATTSYYYSFRINANSQALVVQNCIFYGANFSNVANTIFINNITNQASANNPMFTNPGSLGNVFNVDYANNAYFLGFPNNTSGSTTLNSPDARYRLSATSPARNAGIIPGTAAATDCGAYGGTNPYKASGIPPIPSFYKLNAPSSTATGSSYQLTFSVKSNN